VDAQRLADDLIDGLARVERRVGILEDHLDVGAIRPHLLARQRREVHDARTRGDRGCAR
jgi:hypothetical protein